MPREGRYSLADRGYLVDPTTGTGKFVQEGVCSFEDISRVQCLILLGEPGIGKSIALENERTDVKRQAGQYRDDPGRADEDPRECRFRLAGARWRSPMGGPTPGTSGMGLVSRSRTNHYCLRRYPAFSGNELSVPYPTDFLGVRRVGHPSEAMCREKSLIWHWPKWRGTRRGRPTPCRFCSNADVLVFMFIPPTRRYGSRRLQSSSARPSRGIGLGQLRTAAPFVLSSASTRTGIVTADFATLSGALKTSSTQFAAFRLNASDFVN